MQACLHSPSCQRPVSRENWVWWRLAKKVAVPFAPARHVHANENTTFTVAKTWKIGKNVFIIPPKDSWFSFCPGWHLSLSNLLLHVLHASGLLSCYAMCRPQSRTIWNVSSLYLQHHCPHNEKHISPKGRPQWSYLLAQRQGRHEDLWEWKTPGTLSLSWWGSLGWLLVLRFQTHPVRLQQ